MRDEYSRLSAVIPDVVIAGDLNSRWGALAPDGETRKTADARPPASDAAWRPFRSWCLSRGIRPTHGRPGVVPGYTTSGAPAVKAGEEVGRAESDYILSGPGTAIKPRRPTTWEEASSLGPCVHRPVTCAIGLKSPGPAAPQQREKPAAPPVAADAAPARYHIPHYNSGTWKKVGEAVCGALDAAEQVTSNAASTFQEAVEAIHGVLARGAELLQNPKVSIRSMTYRRFAGSSVPPEAARLLEIARSLRKSAHAMHTVAKREGGSGGAAAAGGKAPEAANAADEPAATLRKAALAAFSQRVILKDAGGSDGQSYAAAASVFAASETPHVNPLRPSSPRDKTNLVAAPVPLASGGSGDAVPPAVETLDDDYL